MIFQTFLNKEVKTLITMNLLIDSELTISIIQKNFNEVYPFLKLEFLDTLHIRSKFSFKSIKLSPDNKLKILTGYDIKEQININYERTILEVERDFFEKLVIFVRIYRRTGKVWVETSLTDNWTLKQQNEEGKQLSML